MTPEKQAEIRRRAEAATAGPWKVWKSHLSIHAGKILENTPSIIRGGVGQVLEADDYLGKHQAAKNARFAAHAREDVPALLDALTAAQDALTAAEGETGRLRAALAGAVEAMTPLSNNPISNNPNGTAQRKCLYCRAWTIYDEIMKHSPGCPFLLAQSALSAGED